MMARPYALFEIRETRIRYQANKRYLLVDEISIINLAPFIGNWLS